MSELPWLDTGELYFPPTHTALQDPNGLLAVGGDLTPERLLLAYQQGIFPWYEQDEPILWWSPCPRAVLVPDNIHISKSLNKRLKRGEYYTTCNQAFEDVIHHCSHTPRDNQHGTWITDEIINAYCHLHKLGYAHSIETWHENELVGGLYGISLGKMFFGESMFSMRSDASKVAFVSLAQNLQSWGYPLIDCQVTNPHLTSLGASEINRDELNHYLEGYTSQEGVKDWATKWQQAKAL